MFLSDNTPVSVIAKANLFTMSNDERIRRELAIKNKDFFYSNQEKYVSKLNLDVDALTINLTNIIINKKNSLLYTRSLLRNFNGPSTSISFLDGFYKSNNMDTFLRSVDLASELTGTGLVGVFLDVTGETILGLFDASEFSAIATGFNENKLEALSLVTIINELTGNTKRPDVKRFLKSQTWTEEWIVEFTDGIRMNEKRNEMGFLPFVPFKGEEVYGQYIGHAPATLITQINSYLNQQMTNLGYMIKMQSGTPIILTGFSQGDGVNVHPGSAISLPIGASASALSLSPKILETLEEVKYIEQKLYETSGIPKVSVVGDDTSNSGKQLLIKWAPLIATFKDKALRFKKYELDLANMILKVNNLEPIESLDIEFDSNILPISEQEENLERDIKLNLKTPADELIRRNPNLSEDEADSIILANKHFNLEPKSIVEPLI